MVEPHPVTMGAFLRAPDHVRHTVEKFGAQVFISDALLGQTQRREWTEEERAEHAQRVADEQELTVRASVALAGEDDPFVRALLDLHSADEYGNCRGCDFAGYDAEPPEYPCRTVALVAYHASIEMPETWRPRPACDPMDDNQDHHVWTDEALATCIVCGALSQAWEE